MKKENLKSVFYLLSLEPSTNSSTIMQGNRTSRNRGKEHRPHTQLLQVTHQSEDLEEVQISIKDVLYLLQPLLAEGTHSIADAVESHSTGEDDEALQQGLTARNVFQLQVWDTIGKLDKNASGQSIYIIFSGEWHKIFFLLNYF